jgi:chromosome segregation ATPase
MCIQEVVKAAKISNCNLPSMERRYATLLSEVNVLEFRKQRLEQEIDKLRSDLQYYSSALEQQRSDLQELYQQTRNQESVVQHFRNNDPTYQHVKKSVEDKAIAVLSNSKPLLQFVARTLFHSMISNPNNCAWEAKKSEVE